MRNIQNDLDRIEKMFNKTIWLIGILMTIFIGGTVTVFFTVYQNVITTASTAKKEISDKVDELGKTVVQDITKKIDIDKLSEDVKHDGIKIIEKNLSREIEASKETLLLKNEDLTTKYNELDEKVISLKKTLDTLYIIQDIEKIKDINIYSLSISPSIPNTNTPLVANCNISSLNLPEKDCLNLYAEFIFQKEIYPITGILMKGSKTIYLSSPIQFNKTVLVGTKNLTQSAGKYSLEVRIYTSDKKVILSQSSTEVTIY